MFLGLEIEFLVELLLKGALNTHGLDSRARYTEELPYIPVHPMSAPEMLYVRQDEQAESRDNYHMTVVGSVYHVILDPRCICQP